MKKITVKIDGMMCGMCEAHICDTIRRAIPDAKKVSASRKSGEATFLSDGGIDEEALKANVLLLAEPMSESDDHNLTDFERVE